MTQMCLDGEVYPSKVEAAWAVYLGKLGVPAQHEPFVVGGSGSWYIPDFVLPNQRIILEVKLGVIKDADLVKWKAALRAVNLAMRLVVVNAHPPGSWYLDFVTEVEIPVDKFSLRDMWHRGYLPHLTHDTALAGLASHEVSVGRRATDSEVRDRRVRLTELPLWNEWLTQGN